MAFLRHILKQHTIPTLLVIIALIALAFNLFHKSFAVSGGPFTPSETLDPDCVPGGTCQVNLTSSQFTDIPADTYVSANAQNDDWPTSVQYNGDLILGPHPNDQIQGTWSQNPMSDGSTSGVLYLYGSSSGGGGGRIFFGDIGSSWANPYIGERWTRTDTIAPSDTDKLDIAGKNGIYFLTGGGNQSNAADLLALDRMVIDSSGRVGIGNISPTEKLDVTGNVKFSGALMPNNSAGTAGQVLTSAGAGSPPTWETAASSGWSLTGNAGTVDGTNFIGTTDNVPLNFKANSQKAGRIETSLFTGNTFFGYQSGNTNTGTSNTAFGFSSLKTNTSGGANTSFGFQSMRDNTTGGNNAAFGINASAFNTTGGFNAAFGSGALQNNTTGSQNIAIGWSALFNNTTANNNEAFGVNALYANTTGSDNLAAGYGALQANTTGSSNAAFGENSLAANTTGTFNTAIGINANVSSGALTNATAIGANAVAGASNTLILGSSANVGIGTSTPTEKLQVEGGNIWAKDGFILQAVTSDPGSPAVGQMWLRSDL